MSKYIDIEAVQFDPLHVVLRAETFAPHNEIFILGMNEAIKIVNAAPAADVRPVVRGKWLVPFVQCSTEIVCSACFAEFPLIAGEYRSRFKYCPNCGADMRGIDNG